MNDRDADAKRLLRIAQRNYKSYLRLQSGGEEYATDAKFFAQQAIEKCLKAVIAYKSAEYDRVHDLLHLADQATEIGYPPPFAPVDLAKLNPFGVMLRYDDIEMTILSYHEANRFVEAMLVWAKEIIEVKQ